MNFIKDFYLNYVSLNLSDYSDFGIDLQINKILFFVSIILCIASFVISSYERNLSLLLRKLCRSGSFSADNAKTLSELGISDNKAIKSIITKRSGISKKLIVCIDTDAIYSPETEEHSKDGKKESLKNIVSPIDTSRFYINAEEKLAAENYYKTKNSSVLKTVIYCAIILVFYVVTALLMPSILSVLDSLVSN